MSRRPSLHPAFLERALDVEADVWAEETSLYAWVCQLAPGDKSRKKLMQICKLVFVEGLFRGACNVTDGKPLSVEIAKARAPTANDNRSEMDQFKETMLKLLEYWEPDGIEIGTCGTCGAWMTHDEAASVDDEWLCPKVAYEGIKFQNEPCFRDVPGRMIVKESERRFFAEQAAKREVAKEKGTP